MVFDVCLIVTPAPNDPKSLADGMYVLSRAIVAFETPNFLSSERQKRLAYRGFLQPLLHFLKLHRQVRVSNVECRVRAGLALSPSRFQGTGGGRTFPHDPQAMVLCCKIKTDIPVRLCFS